MGKYNHYSFDLWLTLIKSNPDFKKKRNELFIELSENVSSYQKGVDDIIRIINHVDVGSNKKSEVTGIHIDSKHMIYDILSLIIVSEEINSELIDSLDDKIQDLFVKYPPTMYDKNTKNVLKRLHEEGCILNILSNTGFIKGETLEKVFIELGISEYFEFSIFSDEYMMSKPNENIFTLVKTASKYDVSEILHVGDNPIADGGSVKVGIDYFQINSNNKTIKDLLW